jgi:hypothetical protein
LKCYDKVEGGAETKVSKDIRRCEVPEERRRLAENNCFKSIWVNPDPSTDTTSGKAVDAWLA